MDVLDLARLQFALTTVFHFFFVPISIGLSLLIAIMETVYVVKKDEKYKQMAKFWGTFLIINFALGIVTGILQEFQFGMNWSEFSRFVGDVFGAPLAIEALLAFFLESTFIGLWVFGWNRLPKKVHLACIWLVSLGTMISAFWILAANSFMQRPVGYTINNGRAEMVDFVALLTNGKLLWEFPHTVTAALATGAFLVAGISAWKLLKKEQAEFFRTSFKLAIVIALLSSVAIAFFGHGQSKYMIQTQPMKMAAAEGLWETSDDPAPWTVFAVIDEEKQENKYVIKIPYLLSYLSYGEFSGAVRGMKELQAEYEQLYGEGHYIPPVNLTFWSFRIMVAMGFIMIFLAMYGTYMVIRQKTDNMPRWFLRMMIIAVFLPFIANTSGWIMTEIGRQPWTVFGLLTIEDAVSPGVTASEVWFSLVSFTAIYLVLLAVLIYLFIRTARQGPYRESIQQDDTVDPYEMEGGGQRVAQ